MGRQRVDYGSGWGKELIPIYLCTCEALVDQVCHKSASGLSDSQLVKQGLFLEQYSLTYM